MMDFRPNARRPIWLASLLAFASAAAGCQASSGRAPLILWHAWGGPELVALKTSVAAFEKVHPEIPVMALQVPSDRLEDKYLRSAAGNGGPDLLIGNTDWVGKFVETGVLAPVQLGAAERARYLPQAVSALTYQGHLWAVPESVETLALYYNKTLLPGGPPADLASIPALRPRGGAYALAAVDQFFFTSGCFFGLGGQVLGPHHTSLIGSPASVAWLGFLADLGKSPSVVLKGCDYGRADALFSQGKAAMTINGPWALASARQALGEALGVAPLPPVRTGVPEAPFVGVKCFMFNPGSSPERQRDARTFVDFFTAEPNMAHMMADADHVPAEVQPAVPAGSPLAAFAAQARHGTLLPVDPQMKEVWPAMDQAIEEALTGAKTPMGAVDEAQTVLAAKFAVGAEP